MCTADGGLARWQASAPRLTPASIIASSDVCAPGTSTLPIPAAQALENPSQPQPAMSSACAACERIRPIRSLARQRPKASRSAALQSSETEATSERVGVERPFVMPKESSAMEPHEVLDAIVVTRTSIAASSKDARTGAD
eukprot:5431269-Prymnesium_polylepis.1